MVVKISLKFHKNISNGFQSTKQTPFCDRQMDRYPWQKQYVSDPEGGRHKKYPSASSRQFVVCTNNVCFLKK